jgi:hypothetical protein
LTREIAPARQRRWEFNAEGGKTFGGTAACRAGFCQRYFGALERGDVASAASAGDLQYSEMMKYDAGGLPDGTGIFAARQEDIEADRKGQRGHDAKHDGSVEPGH